MRNIPSIGGACTLNLLTCVRDIWPAIEEVYRWRASAGGRLGVGHSGAQIAGLPTKIAIPNWASGNRPVAEVGAIHPKAMPVILTTGEEREAWMMAPLQNALKQDEMAGNLMAAPGLSQFGGQCISSSSAARRRCGSAFRSWRRISLTT
jgi:hypothetical protein